MCAKENTVNGNSSYLYNLPDFLQKAGFYPTSKLECSSVVNNVYIKKFNTIMYIGKDPLDKPIYVVEDYLQHLHRRNQCTCVAFLCGLGAGLATIFIIHKGISLISHS